MGSTEERSCRIVSNPKMREDLEISIALIAGTAVASEVMTSMNTSRGIVTMTNIKALTTDTTVMGDTVVIAKTTGASLMLGGYWDSLNFTFFLFCIIIGPMPWKYIIC